MAKRTRVRRRKVTRTEPQRSFSGSFGNGDDAREVPPPGRDAQGDPRSASYEAINSAYRVIDEYMRQGQRLAEELWLPSSGFGGQGGAEVPRTIDRFLRSASEMGSAWLEMMASTAAPAQKDEIRGTAGPFGAGKRTDHSKGNGSPPGLSIAIQSQRPVRIAVDAPAGLRDVQMSALIATDHTLPPLTAAQIEIDAHGEAVLRIVVPPEQPPGRYHGVLLDRQSERPVGTATLTVE